MQLALIAPLSLLTHVPYTGYHLMLPQLVKSSLYCNVFSLRGQDDQQYVILDNGAAEGYDAAPQDLIALASAFKVDELVLPDVMGDARGTLRRVREFMQLLADKSRTFKLGVVATGQSVTGATELVYDVFERYYNEIDVIYIPRLLVKDDDKFARIRLADRLAVFNKEIHLLGANSKFIREMQVAAGTGIIRGMDTSAPFNYTYHEVYLENHGEWNRPDGYFSQPSNAFDLTILQHNINLALKWAGSS